MKRKLYLTGELAKRYGEVLTINVSRSQDVFKLLEANFPDFKEYILFCHENNISFEFFAENTELKTEKDLAAPLKKGDIYFGHSVSGAAGKGKALLKLGAGAILFFLGATVPGLQFLTSIGINLMSTGMQDLLAPDPVQDVNSPQSYLFNGSEQNIIEGDPVPVLYGELRVPGRPISLSVISGSAASTGIQNQNNVVVDRDGNIYNKRPPANQQ
jgi:predicted phage tail protein